MNTIKAILSGYQVVTKNSKISEQIVAIVVSCIVAIAYPLFLCYQNEDSYSSLNMQMFKIFSVLVSTISDELESIEFILLLVSFVGLILFFLVRTEVQRHNSLVQWIVLIHVFQIVFIFEFIVYDVPIVNSILEKIV